MIHVKDSKFLAVTTDIFLKVFILADTYTVHLVTYSCLNVVTELYLIPLWSKALGLNMWEVRQGADYLVSVYKTEI